MNVLTRYMLRQLIMPALLALVAFAGAVWLSQSLRFVDLIVNKGLSMGRFLYLTSLLVPSLVLVVLPFAAFIGALAGYLKLRGDSEISVCRATGLSDMQIARGAIWLGMGFALASYTVSLWLMPVAYQQFRDLRQTIMSDFSAVSIQEGVFTPLSPGLTVFVRDVLADGELASVIVHDTRVPPREITVIATRGELVQSGNGPVLQLRDGSYQERTPAGGLSLVYFDDTTLELTSRSGTPSERIEKTREMSIGELLWPAEDVTDAHQRNLMIAEGHERLSWPLLSLALPLVAAAATLRYQAVRQSGLAASAVASLVAVGLVVGSLTALSVVKADLRLVPILYLIPGLTVLIASTVLASAPSRGSRVATS
ncbi:MAG: LptF/LptG family permease [Pseudomonadota bacterium]